MAHARLTPEIKKKAEAILKDLGISISAAYELFYRQIIAHQGIPFDLRIPNSDTLHAIAGIGSRISRRFAAMGGGGFIIGYRIVTVDSINPSTPRVYAIYH